MSNTDESSNGGTSIEIVDEGPCRKRIRTSVPASQVEEEVASSYQQLRKSVQIPGFRKGKVPRSVLERRYGEKIIIDVRDELMQKTFEEELKKQELRLIGTPSFDKVEFEIGQPFTFEAVFDIAPSFELPKYKGLAVDAEDTAVDDIEVESELQTLREQSAEYPDTDSPTTDDFCQADVSLGDDPEDRLDREGVFLKIADERVDNISVEGLAEKLVAASPGDELSFDVEVPEDFSRESLRGSTKLTVKVTGFRRQQLPELDDAFAERFQLGSIDDLRSEIRKSLEQRRTAQEENRQEDLLVDQVIDSVEMDLPESIVEAQTRELANGIRYRLSQEGKPEEEIEATVAADTSLADNARRDLKKIFVLEKIAEKEVVLVTEDEIFERLAQIANAMGRDLGEVAEEYRSRGMFAELRAGMVRDKVRAVIRKKAKVSGADAAEIEGSGEETDSGADSDPEDAGS